MQLSSEEAARELAAIRASRESMRSAVRAHRGHYHLWLWGVIWIAMALLAEFRGQRGIHLFPLLGASGVASSVILGILQSSQVRTPVDKRFLGVLAAVLLFAVVAPLVLHAAPDDKAILAYCCLAAMLCYMIAGIWFDTYLLWLGLVITGLILVGLFCFAAFFWWWIAIFGGGTLILTGFYIRYCWR